MRRTGDVRFLVTMTHGRAEKSGCWFFDRERVMAVTAASTRRSLSKVGAWTMTDARGSIRPRKSASAPGNPPSSHTGVLKHRIFFAYDPVTESVIIGPEATHQIFFSAQDGQPVTGTGAHVLEEGGAIRVFEVHSHFRYVNGHREEGDFWKRADLRSRRRLAGKKTRMRTIEMAARPYMGPALERTVNKLASIWTADESQYQVAA